MIDKWSVAHRYNKLVKAGLATPLTTPDGVEYILRSNKDYEPCYWNAMDDSFMTPGADFWLRMRDAVDSVDIDRIDVAVLH